MNPMTALWVGSEAVTAGKKAKVGAGSIMKGNNKYNKILKNDQIAAPKINTEPKLFKSASEELDFLYEVAGGKEVLAELREIREDDKKHSPYLFPAALLAASAGTHAIVKKDITAPGKLLWRVGPQKLKREVGKAFGRAFPSTNSARKAIKDISKASKGKAASDKAKKTINNNKDWFDPMIKKAALEGIKSSAPETYQALKGRKLAKKLFKEDFIRGGLEAIPFWGVPAAAGMIVGKNIYDPSRDRDNNKKIVVDVPANGALSKMAASARQYVSKPWKDWAREDLSSAGARGLGRALAVTGVVGVTGRNIRGRWEKMDGQGDLPPVEEGKIRLIIEQPASKTKKKASEELDKMFAEKLAANAVVDAQEKIKKSSIDEKEKIKNRRAKALQNYDGLKQGVLKQVRMNPGFPEIEIEELQP